RDGEAGRAVTVDAAAPVAVRRAEKRRLVGIAAAADHVPITVVTELAGFSFFTFPRRAVHGCSLVVDMKAILDPFPDVAVHVVEAKRVGSKRADRSRLLVIPLAAATVAIGVVVTDLLAPRIRHRPPPPPPLLPFAFPH